MQLTERQLQDFDRDGYLFFPSLFSDEEMKVLLAEIPGIYAQHRPEIVREKGSDSVRTVFAGHLINGEFAKLGRHPRMIEPVRQVLDMTGFSGIIKVKPSLDEAVAQVSV